MRVHVWSENRPLEEAREQTNALYPRGIEGALAELFAQQEGWQVTSSVSQDPDYGLAEATLSDVDVLVYWSHKHWREVPDEAVERIYNRVLGGMGVVFLHSAHAAKIFNKLLGTRTQTLRWREADEMQRVWIVHPSHPICSGLQGEYFEIPVDETYGEYFEVPPPDDLVFITVSEGGEVLRSGLCYYRGRGKVFYFASGHETYPVYYQKEVQQVLTNAVRWAYTPQINEFWPQWAREAVKLRSKKDG